MGLLSGKKGLIFGVANERSIAWGIARALAAEGAELGFTYAVPDLERRVRPLAESVGAKLIEPCDVTKDEEIRAVFQKAREVYGSLDILVHSIAFAKREELAGRFVETSREGWRIALEISAYSLVALVQEALPLLNEGASVLTMTYYGSEKVIPHYNVMGVAKAALEATVRYLAADLGPQGIRVNAISAGPVRTLAAAGIRGFRSMYKTFAELNPLRTEITADDIGQLALFLCSDGARKITGEVIYVDGGFHILGMPGFEAAR